MKQHGFTLIELVMVIVILGILSAFAIPRYADFSNEAKIAKLEGMLAAIRSATAIAYADGKVQGISDGAMVFEGNTIQMAGGYPTAQWNATFYALINDSGRFDTGGTAVCTVDWCTRGNVGSLGVTGATSARNLQAWPEGTSRNDNCYVWYHNGNSGGDGLIDSGIVSTGC